MNAVVQPGACLGVVGGGQLGRMFVQAAQRMGYQTLVLTDEPDSPAADVACHSIVAAPNDMTALRQFRARCAAATVEFENVHVPALRWLERFLPVNPGWRALWVAQNRIREKSFLQDIGVPVARWQPIRNERELAAACRTFAGPCILKTAAFGYDGKGQGRVQSATELATRWRQFGGIVCVLEDVVEFAAEVSCLVARGPDGAIPEVYPVFWNKHVNQVLDTTVCPAPFGPLVTRRVQSLAHRIASALAVKGLLTVEFFLTGDGEPLVNEIAPRPHNSAHLTIEACCTSQFEQQVRALCGLPLGSTELLRPAAMANLLGDLWARGEPNWSGALAADPALHLHLYGKKTAKPGRKMGHLTVLDSDAEQAHARVLAARRTVAAAQDLALTAPG